MERTIDKLELKLVSNQNCNEQWNTCMFKSNHVFT